MKAFFEKTLRRWILPTEAETIVDGLEYWRNQIFFMVCRLLLAGGLFVYAVSAFSYVQEGAIHMLIPVTTFTVLLYIFIFLKNLNPTIRRWGLVVVFILLGVYLLIQKGFQGVGLTFLFAHPLLATVFFKKKASQITLWINVLVVVVLNVALWTNPALRFVLAEYQPVLWISISISFLLLSVTVTNAIVGLVTGLNDSLNEATIARENLEEEIRNRIILEKELKDEREGLQIRINERTSLLAQANEDLMKSMKFKDAFFDSIRHEFRTPIHAISGYTDLLLSKTDNLNEKQHGYLTRIRESADNLLGVVNDILDTTRIQAGLLDITPVVISLSEVCKSALSYMEGDAIRKGLIVTPIKEDCEINVRADAQRFKQILTNLLSNSIKYTPEGGSLGVNLIRDEEEVKLVVWDTGIGIPEKDLENIFEPFYRSENRNFEDVEGTGLGLSLAKQLIEAHGWKITVESVLNKGSRFYIHIPIRDITDRNATIYY